MIRFSVIIPTLNEESIIGRSIDAVRSIDPSVEIIVSDGGSTDGTVEISQEKGVKLCQESHCRGQQMNAGAALATGDVLIFLHADTFLPVKTFHRLATLFSDDRIKIGVFKLKFDTKHWVLGLLEKLSAINPRWFRFGDSTITVRRDFFQTLGGFPDQPLFEDLTLLRRASRRTTITLFRMRVTTSARRFIENGIVRQLMKDISLTIRYLFGASTLALAASYGSAGHLERKTLLMMVRYPEPGRVKSRLAADLGEKHAAGIYHFCAETLFGAAANLPATIDKYLYCSENSDRDRISLWGGGKFSSLPQHDGDLSDRLVKGFKLAFGDGASKVVIVASDIPDISSAIIQKAFNGLNKHDVVIGPSPDGGYYLIGLNKPQPNLFRDIDWSTSAVLRQTSQRVKEYNLSLFLLPSLQDIDTAEDWSNWLASHKDSESLIIYNSAPEVEYAST